MPAKKKKPAKKKPTKPTPKKTARDIKLENYKKAIIDSGGFITKTAEILGITHPSVSGYIKAHPELQELIRSINEKHLDFAEAQLLTLIKEKDKAAIFFYLKCKGKDRGYIERAEYDIKTPGDPVRIMLDKVGKQVETNPELKEKLDKELDDS